MTGAAVIPVFILLSRFWPLSIAGAFQNKDMRVVDKTVGDRCGHRGAINYFFPISKRQIRSNNRWFYLMPVADDMEE